MVQLITIIFFFSFPLNIYSEELSIEESKYFSILDFNNDKSISFDEITQIIQLIFQMLDQNQDGKLTENELIEFENIIKSIS